MAVLLKTAQSGLVSFKSCKLESKTRAKVFGKVDTLETYQGGIYIIAIMMNKMHRIKLLMKFQFQLFVVP